MQQTQNRITQHDLSSLPTRIRVVGYTYLVDFGSTTNAQDLLEVLDDRFGRLSTLVASQIPVADWYARFPDPTVGDGALDRIVHNACRLNLEGDSQQKIQAAALMPPT